MRNFSIFVTILLASVIVSTAATTANAKEKKAKTTPTFEECQKRAIALGYKGRGGAVGETNGHGFMVDCMNGKH